MECFSYGVGKDAIILNKEIGLKLTCLKPGLCKAGFPIKSVENYINTLTKKENSFVIYNKDGQGKTEEIYRYEGKKIYEEKVSLDCASCTNRRDTDEDIIERVKKLGNKQ